MTGAINVQRRGNVLKFYLCLATLANFHSLTLLEVKATGEMNCTVIDHFITLFNNTYIRGLVTCVVTDYVLSLVIKVYWVKFQVIISICWFRLNLSQCCAYALLWFRQQNHWVMVRKNIRVWVKIPVLVTTIPDWRWSDFPPKKWPDLDATKTARIVGRCPQIYQLVWHELW